MKTTLEIPDLVFRRPKSAAADRGIPLREFVTQTVQEKLAGTAHSSEKSWMEGFGKLRRLRRETDRISRLIEEEFEHVEPRTAVILDTNGLPESGMTNMR